MANDRDGRTDGRSAAGAGPARPRSVWVDPEGHVYDWDGDEAVPTGETLDGLATTHDGLDSPVAVMATGWRLYHGRSRPAGR